ncbi:hypothetical protein ACP3TJ_05250 [Desulforudis sp. 1088]|uniref:hypothetical protein n=1 Tax=unclassified Candidatus Desulforudis TaxID=2635950 RepID=UPI0034760CC3
MGKLVARLDELERKQNMQAQSINSIVTKLDQLTEQITNLSALLQGDTLISDSKPVPLAEPSASWIYTAKHYARIGKTVGLVIENIANMTMTLIDSIDSAKDSNKSFKPLSGIQSAPSGSEIDFSNILQTITRLFQGLTATEAGKEDPPPAEPSGGDE